MKKLLIVDLILYLLWFSIFKIFIIPKIIQQLIKFIFLIVIFLVLINRKKKNKLFNISLLYGGIVFISSVIAYINHYIYFTDMIYSFYYMFYFYICFTTIATVVKDGYVKKVIDSLYFSFLILFILSLVTVFYFGVSDSYAIIYFAGSKFRITYMFIFIVLLFCIRNIDKIKQNFVYKLIVFILIILSILFSYYVRCSTSVVGSIGLFLIFFKLKNNNNIISKLLENNKFVVILIVCSSLILLYLNQILEFPIIKYLVVDVLGENTGLTGRVNIYNYLISVFKSSPYFGYGYGNYVIGNIVGYGNAQNGLLEIVINYGLFGAICFLIFVSKCLKKNTDCISDYNYNIINILYIFIFITLITSIIEVSYNQFFFIAISIIYGLNNYKEEVL